MNNKKFHPRFDVKFKTQRVKIFKNPQCNFSQLGSKIVFTYISFHSLTELVVSVKKDEKNDNLIKKHIGIEERSDLIEREMIIWHISM